MTVGIVGLCLSLSCVLGPLGLVVSIVALILARGARKQIEDSAGKLGGMGRRTTALICGWLGLGLGILTTGFWFLVIGAQMNNDRLDRTPYTQPWDGPRADLPESLILKQQTPDQQFPLQELAR
ncbi:MAG: hypothetical protein ACRCTR_02845 [Actinomycetota bacterium]